MENREIHNQTGQVEVPLTTVGEQLSEETRHTLEQVAKNVQSPRLARAKAWAQTQRTPLLSAAAFVGGLFLYALISRALQRTNVRD